MNNHYVVCTLYTANAIESYKIIAKILLFLKFDLSRLVLLSKTVQVVFGWYVMVLVKQ